MISARDVGWDLHQAGQGIGFQVFSENRGCPPTPRSDNGSRRLTKVIILWRCPDCRGSLISPGIRRGYRGLTEVKPLAMLRKTAESQ